MAAGQRLRSIPWPGDVDGLPRRFGTDGSRARRLEQFKARQARLNARLAYLKPARARKDVTRRKILAGAIVHAKVDAGDFDSRMFRRWLDNALTCKDDRELFGPPKDRFSRPAAPRFLVRSHSCGTWRISSPSPRRHWIRLRRGPRLENTAVNADAPSTGLGRVSMVTHSSR